MLSRPSGALSSCTIQHRCANPAATPTTEALCHFNRCAYPHVFSPNCTLSNNFKPNVALRVGAIPGPVSRLITVFGIMTLLKLAREHFRGPRLNPAW
jgi:hypothetical protein